MATLAEVLRQAGYVTPQGQVVGPRTDLAQKLKSYVMNIPKNAAQNLANQRADIDAALTMGDKGIQIGDRAAFERQMAEVPNLMGLTAYHGTPHTIKGKFDISKVGTGEGAQSYGHGMYFAENPEVATQYRKMLSTPYKETASANQLLDMAHGNYDEALKLAQKNKNIAEIHSGKAEHIESANKTLDILNKMKKGEKLEFGNLYKVDIPDEYIPNMLDYDRPILEQPELYEIVRSNIKDPDILKTFEYNAKSGITGANVYQNYLGGKTPAEKSANALKMGIKGIRYLDEGSRIAPKYTGDMAFIHAGNSFKESGYSLNDALAGMKQAYKNASEKELKDALGEVYGVKPNQTSNFVVFDPSEVKILEQNSKPMTRKEIIEQELEKVAK